MSAKSLMMAGVFIGSLVGGYIPALWGADMFSVSGVTCSALGGIAGIWLGYKISRY